MPSYRIGSSNRRPLSASDRAVPVINFFLNKLIILINKLKLLNLKGPGNY